MWIIWGVDRVWGCNPRIMQNGTSMEHEMEATTHIDGRIMSGAAYT